MSDVYLTVRDPELILGRLCSLDGAHLEVTSTTPVAPAAAGALPTGADSETPIGAASTLGSDGVSHLEQEDKPKAGIMAECVYSRCAVDADTDAV